MVLRNFTDFWKISDISVGKRKNPLPEVIKIQFYVLGIIFFASNQGVGASLMPNLMHYGFSLQILKRGGLPKF